MHTTRARCTGQLFVLCLLALFFGQVIECRPDGAPIRACGDMVPQHASSPQSSASPYTIKPEKASYSNNFIDELLFYSDLGLRNRKKCGQMEPWRSPFSLLKLVAPKSSKVKYNLTTNNSNFKHLNALCFSCLKKIGFLMMAFDDAGSVSPIGTFNLKDMGQGIDCRNDGTKVSNLPSLIFSFLVLLTLR